MLLTQRSDHPNESTMEYGIENKPISGTRGQPNGVCSVGVRSLNSMELVLGLPSRQFLSYTQPARLKDTFKRCQNESLISRAHTIARRGTRNISSLFDLLKATHKKPNPMMVS